MHLLSSRLRLSLSFLFTTLAYLTRNRACPSHELRERVLLADIISLLSPPDACLTCNRAIHSQQQLALVSPAVVRFTVGGHLHDGIVPS